MMTELLSNKKIIWQNPFSVMNDCCLIDSLNYIIVGDDGKILSSQDGGENWDWIECGLRYNFNRVDFFDKTKGAVVGDSGAFAITTDGGITWKTGKIDTLDLLAVKFINQNEILTVDKRASYYKTNNYGLNWVKIHEGSDSILTTWSFYLDTIRNYNSQGTVCDISFKGITGFIAGPGYKIFRTTDNGETWKNVLTLSDSVVFKDIDYNNGTCLAVGGKSFWDEELKYLSTKPILKKTTDNGENWNDIILEDKMLNTGVKIYNSNHIYLLGSNSIYYITKNGGKNWSKKRFIDHKYYKDYTRTTFYSDTTLEYGDEHYLKVISSDSYGNILAIDQQSNAICKSTNYGDNYSTIKYFKYRQIADQSFEYFHDFIPITASNYLLTGPYSKVLLSNDNGNSWDRIYPIVEIEDIEDKKFWEQIYIYVASIFTGHFKDSLNGFLAGQLNASSNTNQTIFTNDGGKSWEYKNNLKSKELTFISPDTGFAITTDYNLMKTTDCGNSWSTIKYFLRSGDINEQIYNNIPLQILFPDSVTGYLTVWNGIVKTTDSINYPKGRKSVLTVYKTSDYGKTFDTVSSIEYLALSEANLKIIDNKTSFITTIGNIIYKSNDSCKTYKPYMVPGHYHFIYDVHFLDENYGFAVGRQDTIFVTKDGGESWTIEVLPLNREFYGRNTYKVNFANGIKTAPNGDIYLIGQGRLLRGVIVDDSSTSVEDINVNHSLYYYISIVPNPVLNTTKIYLYGLHYSNNQRLFLRIYDINGNFVKDISEEANRNSDGKTAEISVSLADLPSGIYFVELESNNMIRYQKFIKY
jgi:photosystem II stability/assembly factor-like uncharacterized protein